jgi:serine/threonine-protein kinase HipA
VSEPEALTRAHVHKDGRAAATLTHTGHGVEFRYDEAYLADGGRAIATSLPLSEDPVVTPGRSVPPYFAGLLPEGRRLSALRRGLKVSADDELSLLLAVGDDPVGDVTVGRSAQPPPPAVDPAAGRDWSEISFRELLADQAAVDSSALAGVQDKVSGRMITVPLVHGGRAHLLKLTPPEFPRVVENEAFFLQHASRLPIDVVAGELVRDRNGLTGLLITRFDRVERDGSLARLPAEDVTQLLGLYPADKYHLTTERLVSAAAAACSSTPLTLRTLLVQVAWAWLTGNGDLHGKNVSIVGREPTDGGRRRPEMVLAPAYDLPSTVPYGDHEMALTLGGSLVLTRRRLLECFTEAGLPQRACERALDTTLEVAQATIDDIRAGGSPWAGKARDDLARALDYRLGQLAASGHG